MKRLYRRLMSPNLSRAVRIVSGMAASESTAKWYTCAVNHLIEYFGDVKVSTLDEKMIRNWSDSLYNYTSTVTGNGMSAHTMNGYRRAVRAFFNHLARLELIPESPTANFSFPEPPPLEPKHVSEEDARAVVQIAENTRDRLMMQILYDSGCRIGELESMRVSSTVIEKIEPSGLSSDQRHFLLLAKEYDLEEMIKDECRYQFRGKARVLGKGDNRRAKERTIFFSHAACLIYYEYLDTRPWNSPDSLFLRHDEPSPVSRRGLYYAFKKLAKKAGVDATPHTFRHTFAYRVLRIHKRDPRIAQQLLGHEDVLTTLRIYYGLKEEELWDAFAEMQLPTKDKRNGVSIASQWDDVF